MRKHPVEGELRALRDGAAGRWRALRLRLHLAHCADCRTRLRALESVEERVAALLGRLNPGVEVSDLDLAEGWKRVQVRSGASQRSGGLSFPSFLTGGVLGAAACAVVLFGLSAAGVLPEKVHRPTVAEAFSFLDHCCADHDGDGVPNEGRVMVHGAGGQQLMLVYSDRDGSGGLSQGDVVIHAVVAGAAGTGPGVR
jgi:hypothetical protein